MDPPSREALLERIRALPAGPPLLERLAGRDDVYLVGGTVRDLLLGDRPLDLDLLVDGDVAEAAAALRGSRIVHDRFGTCTVMLEGHTYDLARARRERYPRPGALPEVEPATVAEDLERRDFTVNSIAVPLGGDRAGAVIPAARALEDLAARQLRVLHSQSFLDDPTRLLRLVRYSSRLGFAVEPGTRELVGQALTAGAVDTVTRTRLGNELRLLAAEPDPVVALDGLRELGVDQALHPEFWLRDADLARRALALLPSDGRPDRLALAAAAMHIDADELAEWLDAMAFEAPDRDVIVAAASQAPSIARALAKATRPSQIARAAAGAPAELVALAGAVGPSEAATEWLSHLRSVRLEIDGADLLAAGIAQGPGLGRALRGTLEAKLDGRVSGREDERALALKLARGTG